MKDEYPPLPAIDLACLVPPSLQPDYENTDLAPVDASSNVGRFLADLQVELGRGSVPAAIDAETGKVLTFADLATRSTALAKGLVALGLRPGERVAYRSPNISAVLVVMCAIWKAGGVVAPIPVQATDKDIRFYLDDTGARFLFLHPRAGTPEQIRDLMEGSALEQVFVFDAGRTDTPGDVDVSALGVNARLSDVSSDQVAILWHTGGTTGRPKGCYHTHRHFLLGGFSIGAATGIRPAERWAAAAPIGHALGIIYNTLFTLLHGGTAVLIERYQDPAVVLDAIQRHRIQGMTALSASWAKMLDLLRNGSSHDISTIRQAYAMWQSASASDVYDGWKARGIELLNNFGSTSFATWVIVPERGKPSPRAALGRAAPGYRVAAVAVTEGHVAPVAEGEIGQLAVRGPTGLTYWNRPELQARDVVDGWTLSDDLIRFDQEGNIHYLGRTDFMISSGGFKVAPVEVEEVLARHAAVREVAVVPGPCPTYQEIVVAFVALNEGFTASDDLARELRDFVKGDLVSYKCPRRIEFIDLLPRDPVGKVQTRLVKDWAASTAKPVQAS